MGVNTNCSNLSVIQPPLLASLDAASLYALKASPPMANDFAIKEGTFLARGLMMEEALLDLGRMGAGDVKETKSWNSVTVTKVFIVTVGSRLRGEW